MFLYKSGFQAFGFRAFIFGHFGLCERGLRADFGAKCVFRYTL